MCDKIGVLGDKESILVFAALGLDVHPVEREEQALEMFQSLVQSRQYAIVYVTEALADLLQGEIRRVRDKLVPAVTIIPGRGG